MSSVKNKIQTLSSAVLSENSRGVCNSIIQNSIEPDTNFDITANWGLISVSDQSTFESFLSGQGATSVVVTYFDLTSGRLKAFIDVEGMMYLDLSSIEITEVLKVSGFDSSLQELYLYLNNLTNFNPSIALPSSLSVLDLSNNQITGFDPSIALPSGLSSISIFSNSLTNFDPSIALPNSIVILEMGQNQIIEFNPSIALPSSLDALDLSDNLLTEFNPSIVLPISLASIAFNNNLITTIGYTTSESWANAQPSFTNTCTISFTGNINSITGTNLESILSAKNTSIQP